MTVIPFLKHSLQPDERRRCRSGMSSPLWKVCPLDTSSADSFPAKILTVSHRVTQNAQPLVPHTASESATITDHSDSTLTHLKKNPVLSSSNSQDRGPGPGPKARAVAAERDSAEEDRGVKGPPDPSSTSPLRVLNQTFKHLKDGNRLPSSDRTSRHPISIYGLVQGRGRGG